MKDISENRIYDENGNYIRCPLNKEPCVKNCAWFNDRIRECAVLNLSKTFRSFEMDYERSH